MPIFVAVFTDASPELPTKAGWYPLRELCGDEPRALDLHAIVNADELGDG